MLGGQCLFWVCVCTIQGLQQYKCYDVIRLMNVSAVRVLPGLHLFAAVPSSTQLDVPHTS